MGWTTRIEVDGEQIDVSTRESYMCWAGVGAGMSLMGFLGALVTFGRGDLLGGCLGVAAWGLGLALYKWCFRGIKRTAC